MKQSRHVMLVADSAMRNRTTSLGIGSPHVSQTRCGTASLTEATITIGPLAFSIP